MVTHYPEPLLPAVSLKVERTLEGGEKGVVHEEKPVSAQIPSSSRHFVSASWIIVDGVELNR